MASCLERLSCERTSEAPKARDPVVTYIYLSIYIERGPTEDSFSRRPMVFQRLPPRLSLRTERETLPFARRHDPTTECGYPIIVPRSPR